MTLLSWFGWMDSIKEWGETGDVNFSSLPASATGQYDRLYNAYAGGDSDEAKAAVEKLNAMVEAGTIEENKMYSQLKSRLVSTTRGCGRLLKSRMQEMTRSGTSWKER